METDILLCLICILMFIMLLIIVASLTDIARNIDRLRNSNIEYAKLILEAMQPREKKIPSAPKRSATVTSPVWTDAEIRDRLQLFIDMLPEEKEK